MAIKSILAATAVAALVSTSASAGDQYLLNGKALGGYDAVAYFTENAPVQGSEQFTYEWNGATWLFSSAENRDAFGENPSRYAPAYDGHCAYGVAQGGKVPGDPEVWAIVDDVLYVNINERVQGWWDADRPGFIQQAENTWPDLEPKPASTSTP